MGDFYHQEIIPIFTALSYSRTLPGYLTDDTQRWSVYSSHRHACNLRTSQGNLIALVSPQHGNGPFHMVLPPVLLSKFSQRAESHQPLTSTYLRAMLSGAVVWEPRLTPPLQAICLDNLPEQLQPYHQQFYDLLYTALLDRWKLVDRLAEGGRWLEAGIKANDSQLVARGAEHLIGLGPGLTPLGDDWLVGFLGGLHLAAPRLCRAAVIMGFQQGLQNRRTTQLSALWLHHALYGEFGEPWHELGTVLIDGHGEQIALVFARIAAQGATSGLAALAGLERCLAVMGAD